MKRELGRSKCPINFTTEIVGDTWAMIIMRDMLAVGKKSFKEFLESDERIGTSVLTDKLAYLEDRGLIERRPDPADGRKVVYVPTEMGIDSVPLVYEFAVFGSRYADDPVAHPTWFLAMDMPRQRVITAWQKALKKGDSFFVGEKSGIKRLGLI